MTSSPSSRRDPLLAELRTGDVGTVRYWGHRYRATVLAIGQTRVKVVFTTKHGREMTRAVPVVESLGDFKRHEGCGFVAGEE